MFPPRRIFVNPPGTGIRWCGRTVRRGGGGRRPTRVVGAVGEELGLQAHALPGAEGNAALAGGAGVQEVGGVELDPGLGGPDLHGDAGPVPGEPGGQAQALGGGPGRSCGRSRPPGGAARSPRRCPRARAFSPVKSRGVPETGADMAVGMLPPPTGVNWWEASQSRWPMASQPPLRLK